MSEKERITGYLKWVYLYDIQAKGNLKTVASRVLPWRKSLNDIPSRIVEHKTIS